MPKSARKRSTKSITAGLAALPRLPHRAGLPSRDSIIGVTTPLGPVMAGATTQYRIIHTLEMDEYEKGATSLKLAAKAAAAALPKGDSFKGKSRKAAKLSISKSKLETFDDLKDLIESLAPEEDMISHDPPIKKDSKSGRVEEEERNIRLSAFIYAASREEDNDFHLIIGRDPELTPEIYMTMELSGLPPASKASHKKLKAARNAFKKFYDENFDGILPGLTYDFPDPPIPVRIDGSLFFDITHAKGIRPGPKSLKSRMPVIWEVHPITKMVFEP